MRTLFVLPWSSNKKQINEAFAKEFFLGFIPRVGDEINPNLDDFGEPFDIATLEVCKISWFESSPDVLEILARSVHVAEKTEEDFCRVMESLGWEHQHTWENRYFTENDKTKDDHSKTSLLTGQEIDSRLLWPAGKADKMARRSKLPHIRLPDGAFRYSWSEIEPLLQRVQCKDQNTT